MSPRLLFRTAALAEAVTWALLLGGMFLKYVTRTTELGVQVFGMLHGVVFVAYVLAALVVAVDARWSLRRTALALAAAVPPFVTVAAERSADRAGVLPRTWRLRTAPGRGAAPSGVPDRVVGLLVRNPLAGAGAGVVGVAALTGLALAVGPPVG